MGSSMMSSTSGPPKRRTAPRLNRVDEGPIVGVGCVLLEGLATTTSEANLNHSTYWCALLMASCTLRFQTGESLSPGPAPAVSQDTLTWPRNCRVLEPW